MLNSKGVVKMAFPQPGEGNRYYTAYGVLKNYLTVEHDYTIVNYSLQNQAVDRVQIWVETPNDGLMNFVCIKLSPTQFHIWGYNTRYQLVLQTGYNFADVNTPSPLNSELPQYTKTETNE